MQIFVFLSAGMTGEAAAIKSLQFMRERTGYKAGAIVVSPDGQPIPVFSTSSMSWAIAKDSRISYGVRMGEVFDGGII